MLDDQDGLRVARYLAGECSAEEAEEIRQWIAADPARAEAVAELARVWGATGRRPEGWDTDAAWQELVAKREARQVRLLPVRDASRDATQDATREATWSGWQPHRVSWLARIAAVLFLVAGGGAVWRFGLHDGGPASDAAAPMRLYATARGERADFRLSDGTRVMLGVDSRIQVPADYGRSSRLVYLEGEAYFEVRHDDERPFLVHAANAVTEDLGTAFVMRAYPGDTVAHVVVTEGKVALRPTGAPAGSGTMLAPGDLGRLSRAGVASVTSGVDVASYLAWTRGRLEFANQPLRDVIPALERWYDLSIQFDDSALGAVPVTVSFERESADEAIRALARLLDVRYQQRDRVVQLLVSKSR